MISRAFKVWTEEGSVFAMRLDPKEVWYGMELGVLTIVGFSSSTGNQLELRGVGAAPEIGGKVAVASHGEPPVLAYERISRVQEIPVPPHVLEGAANVV